MKIWKFSLSAKDMPRWTVEMPFHARLIHVGLDPRADPVTGTMAIWAMVETDAPKIERTVHAYGTGWPLNEPGSEFDREVYVGSVRDGPFIWHLFISPEPSYAPAD